MVSVEVVRFQRFALFTQRRVLAGPVAALRLLLVAVAEGVRGRVEADHVAAACRMVKGAEFAVQSRVLARVNSEPLMTDSPDGVNASRPQRSASSAVSTDIASARSKQKKTQIHSF